MGSSEPIRDLQSYRRDAVVERGAPRFGREREPSRWDARPRRGPPRGGGVMMTDAIDPIGCLMLVECAYIGAAKCTTKLHDKTGQLTLAIVRLSCVG